MSERCYRSIRPIMTANTRGDSGVTTSCALRPDAAMCTDTAMHGGETMAMIDRMAIVFCPFEMAMRSIVSTIARSMNATAKTSRAIRV